MKEEEKRKENPKKRFKKIFDELATAHNAWQVWSDFIDMSTYCIANRVDFRNEIVAKREGKYTTIAKKYSENELEKFSHLFGETVLALDENSEQDFLGEFYMNNKLGNGKKGQYFTPWHVSELMAKMIVDEEMMMQQIAEYGYSSVHDPTCGSGVMLMAFAKAVQKSAKINYQSDVLFVGQDIDPIVAKMCYIQISLLGCPGYVIIGNSLTEPVIGENFKPNYNPENIFYTPFYFRAKFRINKPKKDPSIDKKVTIIPLADNTNSDMEIEPEKFKSQSVQTIPRKSKKTQNKKINSIIKFFTGEK